MTKIKDFEANNEVETMLRLSDISFRKTTANTDYASMMGYDGEDLVDVKIWNLDDDKRDVLENGEVYIIRGRIREYQGRPQLNVSELEKVSEDADVDLSSFYEYADLSVEELTQKITSYINEIKNPILNDIVSTLINKYNTEFFTHPAALVMHHNYYSGLAFHVYTMLELAAGLVKTYPYLNSDLLYAGIILHDLGKVLELSGPKGTEYTKIGNLIGHITLCTNEIYRVAYEKGIENTDEVIALMHLVVAHHGFLEYGSPKEPLIAEAVALHFLDNMDAKMATFSKEITNTEKGEFTNPLPIHGRKSLYNPDIK